MTDKLEIKLLSENATKPKRADNDSAGYDIHAAETVIIQPQNKTLVKTDLAVNIPNGYVGLLTSRSGVSSKTDLVVETGKIDAGFQGHMKINVKHDGVYASVTSKEILDLSGNPIETFDNSIRYRNSYQVNKGDRLAQLVIVPIWTPELVKVEEFSNETTRGEKGFGSTGH